MPRDTWHKNRIFRYWCYYPHTTKDSVSLGCDIFNKSAPKPNCSISCDVLAFFMASHQPAKFTWSVPRHLIGPPPHTVHTMETLNTMHICTLCTRCTHANCVFVHIIQTVQKEEEIYLLFFFFFFAFFLILCYYSPMARKLLSHMQDFFFFCNSVIK